MTADDIFEAIRNEHPADAWAVLPQLRDGTGWRAGRTADAVAMSLWPSRGLGLHGFEIKVSRGDWLRELKQPAKAESIFTYCDRWWVVIPSAGNIIGDGEIPPTWGLCTVGPDRSLTRVVQAPQLEPKPLDRVFVAAVMRALQKCETPQARINAAEHTGYQRGVKDGRRQIPSADRDGLLYRKQDLLYLEEQAAKVLKRIREDLKPLRAWEPEDDKEQTTT